MKLKGNKGGTEGGGGVGGSGAGEKAETTDGYAVVHAVARNHVKFRIRAPADCKRRHGSFFYSGVEDCRLTVEKGRHRRLV